MISRPSRALLEAAILEDEKRLAALRLVRDLRLPEGAVAGDFVRCAVFDLLHGHPESTQLRSIDVVYFDPERPDPAVDASIEGELVAASPRRPWTVRNLAAARPGAPDLAVALDVYLDTASAVAVRLDEREGLEVLAPFGLEDLTQGRVRPTHPGRAPALRRKLAGERWVRRYPRLDLLGLEVPPKS